MFVSGILISLLVPTSLRSSAFISVSSFTKIHCFFVCAPSCLILCDPVDSSPPVFSVHGIFQARILEWVAISYSRETSQPRDRTCIFRVSCLAGRFFPTNTTQEALGSSAFDQHIVDILYCVEGGQGFSFCKIIQRYTSDCYLYPLRKSQESCDYSVYH